MSQQELLTEVSHTLRELGIEFMLTGSHASSLQGEARLTHDIDLVVDLSARQIRPLLDAFPGDRFYLSEAAVTAAVAQRRTFNLLEVSTGEKVDFWLLTDSPFDRSRFARRQRVELEGIEVDVSSPEDTILMKLLWCKTSGGSEKQFQDAVRVYELQSDLLDTPYLERWAKELEVGELWLKVLKSAEPFRPGDGSP